MTKTTEKWLYKVSWGFYYTSKAAKYITWGVGVGLCIYSAPLALTALGSFHTAPSVANATQFALNAGRILAGVTLFAHGSKINVFETNDWGYPYFDPSLRRGGVTSFDLIGGITGFTSTYGNLAAMGLGCVMLYGAFTSGLNTLGVVKAASFGAYLVFSSVLYYCPQFLVANVDTKGLDARIKTLRDERKGLLDQLKQQNPNILKEIISEAGIQDRTGDVAYNQLVADFKDRGTRLEPLTKEREKIEKQVKPHIENLQDTASKIGTILSLAGLAATYALAV